ncbi:S-methyl-5-thioribose kinase [Xylanibacillus composti]|uniref:Methylthioribose kinase n=1 Tax=Xylanibacillus composti TaxID=1572762 RepID=A0A8J4H6P5_9BACL|nr:S-methyl-5-thioribose kinase [Xylanibacillus composti]MDT9724753.1 S-methyl-5-thioribose kinase [Xylanibacillus composti]GIQ69894.1 methylthioribose kinase [Xylanibacillus composti]
MSSYHALSEQEATAYARRLPDFFAPDAELSCREIGDGNLNLVFHIQDQGSGKSVILKQALPYAKVVGESWPLTLDRARIESEALAVQGRLCPELTVRLIAYEPELALTVMEDLSDHVIMRRGLIEGRRYPHFAEHISEFLARTLFFTSDLGMNQQEKKIQTGRFINPELCKITEDLIFDDPYTDSENNSFDEAIRDEVERIWQDSALHLEVMLLRQKFLTEGQALLHGDLHTGSVFVTETSTKVIDPEFAYYGPMGFDVGAIIANLLLNYAAQTGWKEGADLADYRSYLLQTATSIWEQFHVKFSSLWDEQLVDRMAATPGYKEHYMKQLLQDTVGFAGCKMVRRIIGLSHVADIDTIPDASRKEKAQRLALAIGKTLIKRNRSLASIDEVLDIVQTQWSAIEQGK